MTHTFKIGEREFYLLSIPADSFDFRVSHEDKYSMLWGKVKSNGYTSPMDSSNTQLIYEDEILHPCFLETSRNKPIPKFNILGKLTELTDSDVEGYVEKIIITNHFTKSKEEIYRSYRLEDNYSKTPLDSFLSKLRSEGIKCKAMGDEDSEVQDFLLLTKSI